MTISSFEVEVKVAIRDTEDVSTKLSNLGAVHTNTEKQVDIYFNHPCKSFESTDEALRVRKRENLVVHDKSKTGPESKLELTYKGPKIDQVSKTRFEMSTSIGDIESAKSTLVHLGFIEIATVTKERMFYSIKDMVVSIDLVKDVGSFLEIEKVVESEDEIPVAREHIFSFLESIGLDRHDSIRESYLELLLRKEHS